MLNLDAVNVNLIRFSDVLLWDAECDDYAGNLALAETYVNMFGPEQPIRLDGVYSNGYIRCSFLYLQRRYHTC